MKTITKKTAALVTALAMIAPIVATEINSVQTVQAAKSKLPKLDKIESTKRQKSRKKEPVINFNAQIMDARFNTKQAPKLELAYNTKSSYVTGLTIQTDILLNNKKVVPTFTDTANKSTNIPLMLAVPITKKLQPGNYIIKTTFLTNAGAQQTITTPLKLDSAKVAPVNQQIDHIVKMATIKKIAIIAGIILLVLISAGLGFFFWFKHSKNKIGPEDPNTVAALDNRLTGNQTTATELNAAANGKDPNAVRNAMDNELQPTDNTASQSTASEINNSSQNDKQQNKGGFLKGLMSGKKEVSPKQPLPEFNQTDLKSDKNKSASQSATNNSMPEFNSATINTSVNNADTSDLDVMLNSHPSAKPTAVNDSEINSDTNNVDSFKPHYKKVPDIKSVKKKPTDIIAGDNSHLDLKSDKKDNTDDKPAKQNTATGAIQLGTASDLKSDKKNDKENKQDNQSVSDIKSDKSQWKKDNDKSPDTDIKSDEKNDKKNNDAKDSNDDTVDALKDLM